MARYISEQEAIELVDSGFLVQMTDDRYLIKLIPLSKDTGSDGSEQWGEDTGTLSGVRSWFWNLLYSLFGGLGLAKHFPKIAKFGFWIIFAVFGFLFITLISKFIK